MRPEENAWALNRRGENIDPTNLIFEDMTLDTVVRHLESNGWKNSQSDRLYFARSLYMRRNHQLEKQDVHLFFPDAFFSMGTRYHVRMWQFDKFVLGSAHFEKLVFDPRPRHQLESFDEAKKLICAYFRVPDRFVVDYDALDLKNEAWDTSQGRPHTLTGNGLASVIRTARPSAGDRS